MSQTVSGLVRVAFIVRASIKDGLGHLVRSLSVLREMRPSAEVKLFLLGDMSGRHLLEESEISWNDCISDEICARWVTDLKPEIVVFDTLHFERAAFNLLASSAVTASLSPVFSCMDRVEHLFHRTAYLDPKWSSWKAFPRVHNGLKYTVLPFWLKRVTTKHYREQICERKLSIAISMGGADAPNRTLALMRELGRHPQKLVVWVALGDAYTHSYEELLKAAKENKQEIILLKSNESMWRVLRNVSLVICAGGLTTYEAAYVGIPSINIVQSADWAYLFLELVEARVCFILTPSKNAIAAAVSLVNDLMLDRERLLSMHKSSKRLIPEGGAKRIARQIVTLNRNTRALKNAEPQPLHF